MTSAPALLASLDVPVTLIAFFEQGHGGAVVILAVRLQSEDYLGVFKLHARRKEDGIQGRELKAVGSLANAAVIEPS